MVLPRYPIPKAPPRYSDLGRLGSRVPPTLVPYVLLLRLDRPVGYWLLLLPAWFSILLAQDRFGATTIGLMLLFFFGAVALRGAGCVVNDLWDRDLDRRVERTLDRPLASGAISGRRALAVLIGLLFAGVLVLLFLPGRVWVWALFSLPLIALYPLAKRFLPTPQVVLGLTFSWGAILGWLAVQPQLGLTPLWLYLAAFCWVQYYDSIYATQDKEDDRRMGLHSMPLFLGKQLEVGLAVFAMAALICWGTALVIAAAGGWAWMGLAVVAALMVRQLLAFDREDAHRCLEQFKGNAQFGQIWALFLALDLMF